MLVREALGEDNLYTKAEATTHFSHQSTNSPAIVCCCIFSKLAVAGNEATPLHQNNQPTRISNLTIEPMEILLCSKFLRSPSTECCSNDICIETSLHNFVQVIAIHMHL